MVTLGFDLQPGSLAARPAQLFQPHTKINDFGNNTDSFKYLGMVCDKRLNLSTAAEAALKPCIAGT
eukprot:1137053-Pelagomonas_calceolata.AAC.11